MRSGSRTAEIDHSNRVYLLAAIVLALATVTPAHGVSTPPTFDWLRQFGPAQDTYARGIAANSLGDVFVSSVTITNSAGSRKNVALAKYDSQGNQAWNIPEVTNTGDANNGIWADNLGNAYIASTTDLGLDGPNAGQSDAFVRKYNTAGGVVWTRQIGTNNLDFGTAAVANAQGDVFVTGYTLGDLVGTKHVGWDSFLAKYDSSGTHQWTRQFGTDLDDYGTGLAADGQGNVYVAGITDGSLGGANPFLGREDAYVRKYDSSGAVVWTRQLGTTGIDFAENLTVDAAANVYVTGTTTGHLGADQFGGEDGFVSKLDATGNVQWLRQFGTAQDENPFGIALDTAGRIYLSGQTRGALASANQGIYDAFIKVLDPSGTSLSASQFGTTSSDSAWGISSDGLGSVYVSGASQGSLPSLPPARWAADLLQSLPFRSCV